MQSVLLDSSSNSPLRNPTTDDSDIDFADVFGGPPRRRSMPHDAIRHSFSETADSSGGGALISRRPMWLGESDNEKPVFGDEPANRRRFTTDYFFNDIFRGDESSIGSPRKRSEHDTFGSNPGSRVLSPTRPLPTKAEPYGTSLPTTFSLPTKLMKATEIPTFGSPTRSLSRNRDTTSSSSPLSKSSSQNDLTNGSSAKPDSGDVPEVSGRGRHFHFSIYKWPNKGVPTVLWGSSRLKAMAKAADEETTTFSDARLTSDEKVGKDDAGISLNLNVQTEEKTEPETLSKPPVSGAMDTREANVKPLHSFFADEGDRQGEDVLGDEELRKGKIRGKNTRHYSGDSRSKKKPQGRRSSLDSAKPEESSVPSSSAKPREVSGDGVKGKVKDFVKIFNQGTPDGASGESLGQSFRWKAKENAPVSNVNKATSLHETAQMSNEQQKRSDSSATGQHPPQTSQNKDSNSQNMENVTPGVSGQEWRQESRTADNTPEDTDDSFYLNFQVREITQDENKLEKTGSDAEEIQIIDAKIRKWSQGKDGNIRSLLSTLQYILWPGSGWKPVPLMDMIEGNAVRRSYQKALLILHPDKLQQKGASATQKYIAEKVFELLQEAWDFFNSVGTI